MRIRMLSCEVLARQIYYVAAFAPHVIDIDLVDKGLHSEPDRLRDELQRRLDAVPAGRYDVITLGYGLCSNALVGLTCPHTPMVLPRAHDCITLYLGSGERYACEFRETPGTYWYTPDYMERGVTAGSWVALGASSSDADMEQVYNEYVDKYGRDNADYLMEVMGAWQQHYSRAAYIETQEIALPDYRDQVRAEAERRGWRFAQLAGSLVILRDLLEGRWDEARFLRIEPGLTIVPTHDPRIVATGAPAR
ncbi:MAG: DUF1638 domain-containing protein [Chloroflexi bacterium]|nr:DUF1638 domain-containing protein [Chloroflexota bacterium]